MDDDPQASFEEQALWASLALELLAKAALARVSPLLIATPSDEGNNLLIASGLVEGEAEFHSITAKTLFSRCGKAFRPFDQREANLIAAGRNAYLHGGAAALTLLPPEVWWSRYWAQASILLTAQDKEVAHFVGHERADTVDEHLERNQRHVAERVTALTERAKQRLDLHTSGRMNARMEAEWAAFSASGGLSHSDDATCPACGSVGRLEGDELLASSLNGERTGPDEGDYEVWADLTVSSEYFACDNCHLVLDRYSLIEGSGLPTEFEAIGDPSDYLDEPDYGND